MFRPEQVSCLFIKVPRSSFASPPVSAVCVAHRGNMEKEGEWRQFCRPPLGPQQSLLSLPTSEAKKMMSTKSGEFLLHLDANGNKVTLRASFCPFIPVIAVESGRVNFESLNRGYTVFEKTVLHGRKELHIFITSMKF